MTLMLAHIRHVMTAHVHRPASRRRCIRATGLLDHRVDQQPVAVRNQESELHFPPADRRVIDAPDHEVLAARRERDFGAGGDVDAGII